VHVVVVVVVVVKITCSRQRNQDFPPLHRLREKIHILFLGDRAVEAQIVTGQEAVSKSATDEIQKAKNTLKTINSTKRNILK
jgi:hypothetical protein